MAPSHRKPDAEARRDHERMYGHGPVSEEELKAKYPRWVRNFGKTLPFNDLLTGLFDPLNDNKKSPSGPAVARAKKGSTWPQQPLSPRGSSKYHRPIHITMAQRSWGRLLSRPPAHSTRERSGQTDVRLEGEGHWQIDRKGA